MSRSLCCVLALAFVAAALPACERVQETGAQRRASLRFDESMDSVPRDYGHLVGVSQAGQNPASVSLWFEAADQTITAVRVNTSTGDISRQVIKVPRG